MVLFDRAISFFACLFDLSNWTNQSSLEILSSDNVLINGHDLKNAKYHLCRELKCDALRHLVPFVQFKKREKHLEEEC